jgi:hypothetical protein
LLKAGDETQGGDEMSVRQKVVVIDSCFDCKHMLLRMYYTDTCELYNRDITDNNGDYLIPDWCELDDAADYLQWKKEREVEG